MKASQIRALANIADKPGASVSTQLIAMRRVCRLFCQERATIHQERRALRRKAAKLKAFLPFTAAAVADLEQQAREHRARELEDGRRVMVAFGRTLLLDTDGIAAALGFEALADLLNINRTDRERARREGWRTLSDLIAILDLENSSERRSDEWGAGSPLYEAAFLAMVEFIHSTPIHLLPDPFAPGAPFGPRLPPDLRVV